MMRSNSSIKALGVLLLGLTALAGLAGAALSYRPLDSAPELAQVLSSKSARPRQTLAPPPAPTQKLLRFTVVRRKTPPLAKTLNILLAGFDSRRRGALAGRTDALMVLVLERGRRRGGAHIGVVSIPRDLLVNLPGQDHVRINTAYRHGLRASGSPAAAAALLRRTVHDVLGLPIHHHVFVDHAGFEGLVDTLGGIDVEVRCPLVERFIDPRGEDGHLDLRLAAGVQRLDGKSALLFARARHGRGVIDRNRRQQAVLVGLRDRLQGLGAAGVLSLLPLLERSVFTDLDSLTMARLARRLLRLRRSHLHGLLLRARHAPAQRLDDGRWVMIPNQEAIHRDLGRLFEHPLPGARSSSKRTCPAMDAGFAARRARSQRRKNRRSGKRSGVSAARGRAERR